MTQPSLTESKGSKTPRERERGRESKRAKPGRKAKDDEASRGRRIQTEYYRSQVTIKDFVEPRWTIR